MPRLALSLLALCLASLVAQPLAIAQAQPAAAATSVTAAAPSAQTAPAYKTDPKYLAAIKEGNMLFKKHRFDFAIDAYKKANKIAGGHDVSSLDEIYKTQLAVGDFKGAVATATQLESIATTPVEKAIAEIDRGRALYQQAGDKNKPELLRAAHESFKAALANYPKSGAAHYLDGQTLARLGQLDAAKQEFQECLMCISPKDPSYLRAQHFAENPALSTARMVPAFEVEALDGSRFNLDAMGGRVVLIDFWATWCGPCREELPHIKKIAKEFAGQPLVIISVSWDSDETKWKEFVNKNEMTWIQYRDSDHHLANAFGINSIPHYFTIDSDGALTSEMLGSGSDVEGKLKKLLAKAKARTSPGVTTAAGN